MSDTNTTTALNTEGIVIVGSDGNSYRFTNGRWEVMTSPVTGNPYRWGDVHRHYKAARIRPDGEIIITLDKMEYAMPIGEALDLICIIARELRTA